MAAQGRYWIGTIPATSGWAPPSEADELPDGCCWIRGQREQGAGGFDHFQLCIALSRKQRLSWVTSRWPGHWELTRSDAARDYCWKEDTRVDGTQFEVGTLALRRNNKTDWDSVRAAAVAGDFSAIPSDVYIRCYNQLCRIRADNLVALPMERSCDVFWGGTGTGKSRRAWEEASFQAYSKDPRTKWFCGYRGQEHIVLDEFRGDIGISHLLRWLDRYPVIVETKGSAVPLLAKKFWITSNLDPRMWYPELDEDTKAALLRRLNITHFL